MTVSKKHNPELSGHTAGCADHDYDLLQDLGHRLKSMYDHDQHVMNAKGHDKIEAYWTDIRKQDEDNIKRVKSLIGEEMKQGCF